MYSNKALHQQTLIAEREPDEWITGTELMTVDQRIYLKTLSEEAGEPFDETLSKISAAEHIKRLEQKIGKA